MAVEFQLTGVQKCEFHSFHLLKQITPRNKEKWWHLEATTIVLYDSMQVRDNSRNLK
jgi:hypothetical protein